MTMRALLILLSNNTRENWAREIVALAPQPAPLVLTGTPAEAASYLAANNITPSHILLDIGSRGQDVLPEIDILAQHCDQTTRVLAVGDANDVVLYRNLITRGVADYLPLPVAPAEVIRILTAPPAAPAAAPAPAAVAAVAAAAAAPVQAAAAPLRASTGEKRVISFLSAGYGDGASTIALNTAFALSQIYNGSTILVDMDYQFGMTAKNLNLQNQYGIGDLFDHPDRGLDATLIKRMVASYGNLHVITAPADLRFMPSVSPDAIHNLIETLKLTYDNVILDMPHVWVPWMANVLQSSTHVVLVAQLWLKSVSHASRMARVFRDLAIASERIHTVINRSGAKFKEAIDPKDFTRVYGGPIRYSMGNDIKTVVNAEGAARTILELGPSELATDIQKLARGLCGIAEGAETGTTQARGGLLSRLKG